ncbi:excinuclease ABC subunit B [uncultured Ruegeria sp.]|uniref:excinuclease ABC subunit B n=1 Tax=uncultured Ruegeria sp. TaxID=259304 RepID=UPI0026123300|nr:excinuclease ABC subunit B [uncultured Ruegeria sp.]
MRIVLVSLILGTPATAWEATVGQICTLSHATDEAEIFLTYDPAKPLYTLSVTRKTESWTKTPWFAMRFEGPNPIEIATPNHILSDGESSLTVTDTGFGNVLNGLEYNLTAYAFTQDRLTEFPLDGAAPQVRVFRECAGAQLS